MSDDTATEAGDEITSPSVPDEAEDLLSIAELRIVAGPQPQPYRLHVQVDSVGERSTANGGTYLEARLADTTDHLIWRLFDNNPCFGQVRALPRGAFVEIAAAWVDTGKFGIEPRQPKLRQLSEEERQELLRGDEDTAQRQARDFDTILECMAGLADPRLRAVCALFIERFGERFRRTAAARENHHAWRGGLVEHVAQMMRTTEAVCAVYPHLNRDLMLAGVLFHDCGKLWENSYAETGFTQPYQLAGEMLGHIPLGMEVVNKLWRDVMDGPEAAAWTLMEPASDLVRMHLLHLIGAHHGQLEYGSPVLPKTPEAVALHHIDNIDAKLEMLKRGYATAKEVGPGIYDRFRPWPTRVVEPLPTVPPAAAPLPTEVVEEGTED